MSNPSRLLTKTSAALIVLLLATPATAQSPRKLDRVLDEVVAQQDGSDTQTQRVILRVRAGYREVVKRLLKAQKLNVAAEHPSINGLTVDLTPANIASVCANPVVEGCASDADVTASQTLTTTTTTTSNDGEAEHAPWQHRRDAFDDGRYRHHCRPHRLGAPSLEGVHRPDQGVLRLH